MNIECRALPCENIHQELRRRHGADFWRKFSKSQLHAKCTMYYEYRADFWEYSWGMEEEAHDRNSQKVSSMLNLLIIMNLELTFEI